MSCFLSQLNEAQESTREEVRRLHVQREHYEEAMKKAFMRGVCALNMEAMSMFHGDEAAGEKHVILTRSKRNVGLAIALRRGHENVFMRCII